MPLRLCLPAALIGRGLAWQPCNDMGMQLMRPLLSLPAFLYMTKRTSDCQDPPDGGCQQDCAQQCVEYEGGISPTWRQCSDNRTRQGAIINLMPHHLRCKGAFNVKAYQAGTGRQAKKKLMKGLTCLECEAGRRGRDF